MPQPPSGTVTFLFSDIEGSTQLWESVPDAMRSALERHDALVRAAIEAHGGYVVKTTGDGAHAAFGRSGDALTAAVAIQEALAGESWPEGATVRVRIGVHTGEASERDGDYFGPAVNRAARLMAVAHGGQVVCSQATAALSGDAIAFRSLGEHRLRDLAAAEQLFQVGAGSFPPLRSVDAVPTNLPTVRTELIGRTDDVTALMELVERERLVTLTGVGGVGKTRLALGVAAAIAAGFADGCWLVELSPVADGEEVLNAVAAAIRAPATTADGLVDYLADRRVLIVLDNCEHVLDAAADLVDAVLADCADVHVVVTSREPLGVDGELVRRVRSLAVPDSEVALLDARTSPAVRLFEDRAAAAEDGFTIDAGNVAAVVEICRHLDGIPLAIELAAARVRGMAPPEIARRLDERFRLLAGGSRRAQERHRTLFATVSWSHDLLTHSERITFRRLAVFPATLDLAAAEAVAGDGEIDVVDCVLRLVDRSLVVHETGADRYRLLETLRQYGADRLAESGETDQIRERHARHFLDFAERMSPALNDARYKDASDTLRPELENIRATADWCRDTERYVALEEMCRKIRHFVRQVAPTDLAAWYEQIIDHARDVDDQLVGDCLGDLAFLHAATFGNYATAEELVHRSEEHAHITDTPVSQWAWLGKGLAEISTGRAADALRSSQRAAAAAEARHDEYGATLALCVEVGARSQLGDIERAAGVTAEVLRRADSTGIPTLIASAVTTAVQAHVLATTEPDFTAAIAALEQHPVEIFGDHSSDVWLDVTRGLTLLGLGRTDAAVHLARAAKAADRLDAPHTLDLALRSLAIAAAEAGLTEPAAALASYAETHLREHRLAVPGQAYIQARLDRALPDPVGIAPDAQLHRRDIMTLLSEIELTLTRQEPAARSTRG